VRERERVIVISFTLKQEIMTHSPLKVMLGALVLSFELKHSEDTYTDILIDKTIEVNSVIRALIVIGHIQG